MTESQRFLSCASTDGAHDNSNIRSHADSSGQRRMEADPPQQNSDAGQPSATPGHINPPSLPPFRERQAAGQRMGPPPRRRRRLTGRFLGMRGCWVQAASSAWAKANRDDLGADSNARGEHDVRPCVARPTWLRAAGGRACVAPVRCRVAAGHTEATAVGRDSPWARNRWYS
jgi:hypothetical protein